ncbi:hypothetical protein ADK76_03620, partial [Streptomyces griseoflavus]|uniref:PAS domain S-box protein n=1 Tax=Streptomyces rimosus TaxID=1927 RepID=UPI0004CB9AB9
MTEMEALRNAAGEQELFQGLVECSQDAILIKTLDGRVTFWNAAAQRLYGYRAQEVVGRHIG